MFAFDLISDLHVDTWGTLDWQGQSTSQICVVAGDISGDSVDVKNTLRHLSACYQAVFYIDGNTEHRQDWNQLGQSYQNISAMVATCKDVVYLQNNVVIINGVAILGTNGWWTWDFDNSMSVEQCQQWFVDYEQCSYHVPEIIDQLALSDANYLANSVARLQKHKDVKNIVIVTHTVPYQDLISHDINLSGTYRMNLMGNSNIMDVLEVDTERKISHWCFGHYHGTVDIEHRGVRFINNCRGRNGTPHGRAVYYPLRVVVRD